MSEFGGLWKHQNNPACTNIVSLHNVEEEEEGRLVLVVLVFLVCSKVIEEIHYVAQTH